MKTDFYKQQTREKHASFELEKQHLRAHSVKENVVYHYATGPTPFNIVAFVRRDVLKVHK